MEVISIGEVVLNTISENVDGMATWHPWTVRSTHIMPFDIKLSLKEAK